MSEREVIKKGYKPLCDYSSKQRGQVAAAQKIRGTAQLKDGDLTHEECPDCGYTLRVRQDENGARWYWCPCGYDIPVRGHERFTGDE